MKLEPWQTIRWHLEAVVVWHPFSVPQNHHCRNNVFSVNRQWVSTSVQMTQINLITMKRLCLGSSVAQTCCVVEPQN